MGTEEQSANGGGVATAADTLTITDNRTGKTYEVPIEDGTVRATALRDIKVDDDDFGVMSYDPAFMNTASCRSAITYLDGEAGVLEYRGYPIEQLAEQSTLPRGRLPADPRRAAEQAAARGVDAPDHDPHVRPREHQELHAGLPLRRAPDGHAARLGRRALDVLSGREPDPRRRAPLPADHPADREDADAGGVRLPPQHGAAVRLSGQRAQLPRQLPLDAVPDDRAQVQAGPAAGARAGHPVHPARRPRAELLDQRRARGRLEPGGPVQRRRRRRRRALRPAARRRQRAGAADAAPDRDQGEHPRLHRRREGGQGAPDGLRPPGLQELRPARPHHQGRGRGRVRGHRHEPAARHRARAGEDRARGRVLRQAQAVPERRLLLGPDLRGAADAGRHVHGAVRDPAHQRLDRPVAGDDPGHGAEDRPPAPDLHGRALARLRRRSTSAE